MPMGLAPAAYTLWMRHLKFNPVSWASIGPIGHDNLFSVLRGIDGRLERGELARYAQWSHVKRHFNHQWTV